MSHQRRPNRAAALGVALAIVAVAAGCVSTVAPPPVAGPSGPSHLPGKFVWFDLFTDDAARAKTFYAALFGWTYEPWPGTEQYSLIKSGGETIGGVLSLKRGEDKPISQWVGYVSVDNVDDAVKEFTSRGGTLHRGPLDIPGRGRAALVADPQGGIVALLHSEKGDPPDGRDPAINRWMWIDYVANDTEKASKFYGDLFGYRADVADHVNNREYYKFMQGDRPRGGMFRNPWPNVRPNWLPYVRVADAAAAVAKTKELGGTVVVEPRDDLRNGSVAVALDPTGAGFIVQKYPF